MAALGAGGLLVVLLFVWAYVLDARAARVRTDQLYREVLRELAKARALMRWPGPR